jgi:hypothetical protein
LGYFHYEDVNTPAKYEYCSHSVYAAMAYGRMTPHVAAENYDYD